MVERKAVERMTPGREGSRAKAGKVIVRVMVRVQLSLLISPWRPSPYRLLLPYRPRVTMEVK